LCREHKIPFLDRISVNKFKPAVSSSGPTLAAESQSRTCVPLHVVAIFKARLPRPQT
jgi:hypothetical protein